MIKIIDSLIQSLINPLLIIYIMSINNGFSFSSVGFKFIENCVNSAFRYETLRFTTKKAAGSTRTPGLVKFAHNILNKSTFVSDTNTDNVKKERYSKSNH